MQYIADIKRKEGMEMAEAAETRVDLFISSSYDHEERLNKEIDDMHQFRHEIMQLKADSDAFHRIWDIILDADFGHYNQDQAMLYITQIINQRKTGEN